MSVHYEVPIGQTLVISGPANVRVVGGEMPMVVDDAGAIAAAAPAITSLDPATVESGSPDITLVVSGTGFDASSTIVFADQDEPTTLNDDGTLSTGVKPGMFAPATVPVAVRNGPARSAPMDFTFVDPARAGDTKKRK
jgi:hypothetical protein